MRLLRIFWVFFFLFPNTVMADPEEAAIVAKQAEVSGKLTAELATIKSITAVPEISAVSTKVDASATKFLESSQKASTMCLESTSPALMSTLSKHGLTIQALGTMLKGLADQCSEIGNMIGIANAGIGAFQAQCGTFQALCSSNATALTTSATEYLSASQAAQTHYFGLAQTGDQSAAVNYDLSVKHGLSAKNLKIIAADATVLCGKYKIQVVQAATAGALAIAEIMKSSQCSKKTASTGIDCNDSKNAYYNQKNCMCTRNELPAADCQNMTIGSGSGVAAPTVALGGEGVTVSGDGTPGELFGTKPIAGGEAPGGPSGGELPGAPTSSGGASASGGGGGAQDGASTPGRRLNTNILGGGFGGGGSGSGGSGPGYGETDPSLKAYAPGGNKDANRVVASEIAKQVTNPAGRTNWEKVRNRYSDNLRNLKGQ